MLTLQQKHLIHRTGLMRTQTFAEIFRQKDDQKSLQMLEDLAVKMVGEDDALLRMAYLTVAPLLVENVAISKAAEQDRNLPLVAPEVLTYEEALAVAQADYMLNGQQQNQLLKALKAPLP